MSYIFVINIETTSVEPACSKYDSREVISFKSLLWAPADEASSPDFEEAEPLLLNKAIKSK